MIQWSESSSYFKDFRNWWQSDNMVDSAGSRNESIQSLMKPKVRNDKLEDFLELKTAPYIIQ